MSTLARRVWPLRFIGARAAITVLGDALRAARDDEAPAIAGLLLDAARRRPDSLAVPHLVARWHLLTDAQRGELLLLIGGDWPQLAGYLAQDADPRARAAVARAVATAAGRAALAAPTVVTLLADADETVAHEAEHTIVALMQSLADRTLDAPAQAAARAAAEATIETFDRHRRTAALRAAIQHGLVSRAPATTGKWLDDPDHPAHMVVRGLIRTSADPAMRSCAWLWLKHPSLATACAERLTKADSLIEQSVVLEKSHLALNPRRAAGLAASNRVQERDFANGNALPRLSQFDDLSTAARRGLTRWLDVVPIGARLRDAASAILLTDSDPLVRQSLVVSAARTDTAPACLLDLVFDDHPDVASTAADAVLARAGAESLTADQRERLSAVLTRSSHDSLRHLAAQVAQRPGGQAREQAIADAERLTARFAAEGPNAVSARAVASAVAALTAPAPHTPSDQAAERILLCAAELPDARVRANAIEGLLRRARTRPAAQADENRPIVELILDRATDQHHRIRANAARALLVCGWAGVLNESTERKSDPTLVAAGSRTLTALLADARTMHRVAGLWLAHRLGDAVVRDGGEDAGAQLLDRINHAAQRAIDPMERRWADRARTRIEATVRDRWSQRAPALQEAAA